MFNKGPVLLTGAIQMRFIVIPRIVNRWDTQLAYDNCVTSPIVAPPNGCHANKPTGLFQRPYRILAYSYYASHATLLSFGTVFK